jgi:hypothetical protein
MCLGILPQEILREDGDILAALAQREQFQDHDR